MRTIKKGATGQSLYFDVFDSASSTGGRKTGLAYNTAGLTAYYVRNQGSPTAITLAALAAANSAWSSGGFKEVDASNMPGIYRCDVPDAAFATGADSVVVTILGASGMVQAAENVQLVSTDADNADALLDRSDGVESGLTVRGALRLALSALAGKVSGAGTGTETFRNVGDSKDRITATVDSSGNRTAITTDAS